MDIISYQYSIPYLIFLWILILLVFLEFWQIDRKQGNKVVRQLTLLIFIIFFGFKGYIGRDIFNYYDFFSQAPTLWNWNNKWLENGHFEIGFTMYVACIKSIFPNFLFFNFIDTILNAWLLNTIIKRYSKYYTFSFVIFIVFYGHILEMEQIRNCKSILIFLYSLKYIEDKKILPYMLFNLLGFSFHFSSIVYFPLYFLINKKIPKEIYLITFIIGNIIFLLKIEYVKPIISFMGSIIGGSIQEKIDSYLQNQVYTASFGITIGYIERIATFILAFFIFYKKLCLDKASNLIFLNLYFLYFISYFFFSELAIAVLRLPPLFVFAYAVLLPNIYGCIQLKANKIIMFSILFLYMNIRFSYYHKFIEYKYENILWNDIDYATRKNNLKISHEFRVNEDLKRTR